MISKITSSMKCILFCTLFLFFSCNDSKKENEKKIDVLIKKIIQSNSGTEHLKAIQYAKEAEALALKTNNREKLPYIYLYLAEGLAGLELQKESIEYLNKIMKMDFEKKDNYFKGSVYHNYAYNYTEMGLSSQAVNYYRKSISLLSKSKSVNEQMLLSKAYIQVGIYQYGLRNGDSALYYLKKEENILKKFPEKQTYNRIVTSLRLKGYLLLEFKKQNDSALYYFKKTYDLRKKYNNNYLTREYLGFGDYYQLEGNYEKALEYYHKAEQNAKVNTSKFNENNDVNRVLADMYEVVQNPEKQSFYLKKYASINDSIKVIQKANVDEAVNIMMKKKTEETSSVKKNYTLLLSVLCSALLIVGIFLYRYFKNRKLASEKTEILLTEKEVENQNLKQKVNESFEEVVQLAKDNSPEFFTRFQEVYPEVIAKLLEIDSKLNISDLTLCAYYFLGFKSKDVASHTFKSLSTIRNRRQSIRNKLNISADENMELWFKNLAN